MPARCVGVCPLLLSVVIRPLPASSLLPLEPRSSCGPGGLTLTRDLDGAVGDNFLHCDGSVSRPRTSLTRFHRSLLRTDQARIEAMFDSAPVVVSPTYLHRSSAEFAWPLKGWTPGWLRCFAGDADGCGRFRACSRPLGQMSPLEPSRRSVRPPPSRTPTVPRGMPGPGPAPVHHGPLSMDGSWSIGTGRRRCVVEMYGVGRRVRGNGERHPETARDEVLRVCEIAYQLITGLVGGPSRSSGNSAGLKLSKAWSQWLSEGLDPPAALVLRGESRSDPRPRPGASGRQRAACARARAERLTH